MYAARPGLDQPILDVIVQQPQCPGVMHRENQRRYAGNGFAYYVSLPYTTWLFTLGEDTVYNAILVQLGLNVADSANVTINTLANDRITFVRYNAIVDLPEPGRDLKWNIVGWKDITFTFRDLVEAS